LQRFPEFLELKRIERIRSLLKQGNPKIHSAIKNGYKSSILTADRFFGSILKALEKEGIVNQTLFILTGDHEESFNEHNEIEQSIGGRY